VSRLAVFGFGSLVSRASAAQTLGRELEPPIPVRLHGWRRDWSLARDNAASEKAFALADGTRPSHCLGLNLEPDAAAPAPNGALLELSEAELERLDLREIRYERVEVGGSIAPAGAAHPFEAVYAYRARPAHRSPQPPPGAIVIANYLRAVESAFAELGPRALELFRETTAPAPVQVVEAILVEDRIPPGNPRRW
jgi:hypothetical protein